MSALADDLRISAGQLGLARADAAIAEARLMGREAYELTHRIRGLAERIRALTTIVEAAGCCVSTAEDGRVTVSGSWLDHDNRALKSALGLAEFRYLEATGKVQVYRNAWPQLPGWQKIMASELRAEETAAAAFELAKKSWADGVALLAADQAELRKLKSRRAVA